MKKRIKYLCLPMLSLILEIIPYGAVLNFGVATGDGGGTTLRQLYSYFDPLVFGWANFAPMITGIFTCITLLFIARYCFLGKNRPAIVGRKLCLVTAIINLCPLFYGVKYLSLVGIIISILLVMEAWLLTKEIKKYNLEEN